MRRASFFLVALLACGAVGAKQPRFSGACHSLSLELAERIKGRSWQEGCPVPIEDLGLVTFTHWDMKGRPRQGRVIVHRLVCEEVLEIFRELFQKRFPVEKARPVHIYDGDDRRSMADNNTSGFNCRRNTGRPAEFSLHAYGLAVDINPLQNPQIIEERAIPEQAENCRDRNKKLKGMIHRGDAAWQAFRKRGWMWGGTWRRSKDYQHFEKRSLLRKLAPDLQPPPEPEK